MLEFKSKNGKSFFIEEEDKSFISVLASGYIITQNGEFIGSMNDHGMSFGSFYYAKHQFCIQNHQLCWCE